MANHVNINTSIREIIRIWVNLFCLELDEISRPLAACCSLLQPPFCPLQMPIKVSTIQIKYCSKKLNDYKFPFLMILEFDAKTEKTFDFI